jgi:hypothetical protein
MSGWRFELRCEAEEKWLWTKAAEKKGMDLSSFVRECVNISAGAIVDPVDIVGDKRPRGRPRKKKTPRTQTCEHRISAGAYCKKCDS